MRAARWIIVAGLCIVALFAGCSTGPESAGLSSSSSGELPPPPPPPKCDGDGTGRLAGDCGKCVDAKCTAEVNACNPAGGVQCPAFGCITCYVNPETGCNPNNKPFADALDACAMAQCEPECYPPFPEWWCSPPIPAPSGGSCVTLGGTFLCNPVTGEGCNAAAGESCALASSGEYKCLSGSHDKGICEPCGPDVGFCDSGMICAMGISGLRCARFCCNDGDCGAGAKCTQYADLMGEIGLCITLAGAGGAGGGG